MTDTINEFKGKHRFLSNFGGTLPITSEHLFQAMKAREWESMLYVLAAPTPGEAKRRGRQIECREDWDEIKEDVMWCVIQVKFAPGTEYAKQLLDTGDADLVEGNWWGDSFWGFDLKSGAGRNELGKDLMEWREQLREIEQEGQ